MHPLAYNDRGLCLVKGVCCVYMCVAIPYSLKISRIKNFEVFEDLYSTSKISSSEYLDSVTRVHSGLSRVHVRNLLSQVPSIMALLKYFNRESPLPNTLGPLSEVVPPEK